MQTWLVKKKVISIEFDEGWAFIQNGIKKLIKILEGTYNDQPNEQKLYNKYRVSLEEYLMLTHRVTFHYGEA
ncbi:hypothetical protein PanWU01x14_084840 [Parasponia andersonii]|uniref:Uncharacterized protein n=1 Tax=Parasponia andersonii TaxID=3476 RepID=A0A2P5D9Q6_PARAD|nr:hypothetical protein PanWU01x14_084840 [Parasponia andersonii]